MTACRLGESYISYLDRLSGKSPYVTDKMPANFMHLGYIKLFLPNAKIIHCRRTALDTCLSCYFQHFTNPMAFSNSLEGLGEYYLDYERMMKHWHSVIPGAIMDVDYEDMVQNHEEVARRIVDHCDLEWDEACLDFYNTERTMKTASTWQVRQPIYNTSINRWENFSDWLGPLKDVLEEATD